MRRLLLVVVLLIPSPARAEEPLYEGHPVAHWGRALADASLEVRRKAAWALWNLGDAAAAAAVPLAHAVVDEDDYVRKTAVAVLNRLREAARPAIPSLEAAMEDRSEEEVRRLAWLVARLDPAGAFGSDREAVRLAAAEEQMEPGEKPEAILRGLLGLLDEVVSANRIPGPVDVATSTYAEPPRLRIAAANALGMPRAVGTGELHAAAAAALRKLLLGDPDRDVRQQAAWALGWIERAKPVEGLVADLLKAATKDTETPVRSAAIAGLRTAGGTARPAVPALLRLLGDPNAEIRGAAALTLGSAAEPTEEVIAALAGALEDWDDRARGYAAMALAGFGPKAAPAADAIVAAFRVHDDRGFRRSLAQAIGEVGDAAKAALPDLRASFAADEAPPVEIAFAICRLAPGKSRDAIDRLVAVACSDGPGRALFFLSKLGPAAAAALPALEAALVAADEGAKESLRSTIEAIRGE